jgi:hypothetical protein
MQLRSDVKRAGLLPWLAIVAGPAALFGIDLLRGRVLFWGTPLLQFGPWRLLAVDLIRHGQLPLWNRMVGMGAPLLANYQSALLYPPNWVLPLLGVAWGQTLLVALHLILAGAGMVFLTRRLGAGVLGQAIAGVAYGLSGYLVARAEFLSINAAAAWLPWVVLATDALCAESLSCGWSRRSMRRALALASALALQWLSGHAQTSWYTIVLALVWLAWRAAAAVRWRDRGIALCLFVGACALAGAVAAAQLVPTMEYWVISQRSGQVERDFALSYSFWPWRLTGLLAPDLFGTPARSTYWGFGNFWEDAIYIGALPFLLACRQALRAIRGRGSHVEVSRLLLGVCAASLLLALGAHTPVFPWLYDTIPTFAAFQAPTRWMLLFVFSLALLAGWGAEDWARPTGRVLYWTRLGTAGAAAIGVFAWLGSLVLGDVQPTFVRALGEMGAMLALAGALSLLQPAARTIAWSALVCAVVVVDLAAAGWGLNPTTGRSTYEMSAATRDRFGVQSRVYMSSQLEQDIKFNGIFRFDRYDAASDGMPARLAGLPNTLLLDGVPSANNFDPLVPARYAAWVEALDKQPLGRQEDLLRLMGVGWNARGGTGSVAEYVPVDDAVRWRLYRGARWVSTADAALEAVMAIGFDPRVELVLEGTGLGHTDAGNADGTIEIVRESGAGEVVARVASSTGTWFLLADMWYPGWRALIDGQDAPSYPADSLFRAVWVPAGVHEVAWVYRPPSALVGIVLSCLGLLALGGLWIRCRRD